MQNVSNINSESLPAKRKLKRNKSLVFNIKRSYGRNSAGHISSRYKSSGGHKKLYRKISFKRGNFELFGNVIAIENDPNRNCFIALVEYKIDGKNVQEYIIAPENLKVNDKVIASQVFSGELNPGYAFPLRVIPIGTIVHNVELSPNAGGKMARSAGSYVTLVDRNNTFATLALPSGETRMVLVDCFASIGVVSNSDFANHIIGKAGRSRLLGRRPRVRGIAKNPVDHPHGGRSNGGRHPVTPWGKKTKGLKTRKLKNKSNKMIVRTRAKNKKN